MFIRTKVRFSAISKDPKGTKMKKILYPCLVSLLLLAACGGETSQDSTSDSVETEDASDASDASDNEFILALSDDLVTQDDIDSDTALCFATETVGTFGEDRLREWGFGEEAPFSIDIENLPMEKISKDELRELLSKERTGKCFTSEFLQETFQEDLGYSLSTETTECLIEIRSSDWLIDGLYADSSFQDSPEFLNSLVEDCPNFVGDILVSELGISQEGALCLGENTTGDTYALFAQSIIDPSDELSEETEMAFLDFLDIADECGVDFLNTGDSIDVEAFTFGDDATLDALWERCVDTSAADSKEACENLYYESPYDSEYEALGACLNTIWGEWDTTLGECNEPFTYGDSPILDELWERCVDTNAIDFRDACSDLYYEAPDYSEYEELGDCLSKIWGEWDTTRGECNDAPYNYGDSPDLDELWEDCLSLSGSDERIYWESACGTLAENSPYDSEYQALAECILFEGEWNVTANECVYPEPLHIGTLLPETGNLAVLSAPLVLAVDMAIRDINAAGGVNGEEVILTKGDSGTDTDIANTTVDRLLIEDVDAIVGAAASAITNSVIEKVTSAGVTQCSPSNTAAGLGVGGDDGYYFRTAPSDDLQAPALADQVLYDGFTNVAIVSRADDYGVGFNRYFEPEIAAGGGTIVYNDTYPPEATNFDDVVQDVIAAGPDAVVIVAFEEGVQIIQTMVEQGAGPNVIQIYITDGMANFYLGELINPANPGIAEGIKGTQPSAAPLTGAAFFPAAFAAFAPDVSPIFSAQAYDCAILIALAAEAAGSNNSADIAAQMVAVSRDGEKCSTFAECKDLLAIGADIDYEGASGYIDFLDVGEPSVGSYDIYEYDADGVQQVYEELTFGP